MVFSTKERIHKLRLTVSKQSKKEYILEFFFFYFVKKGDFFGEYSFFTNFSPTKSIRSLAYSTLYCIDRDDFIEAVRQDLNDYVKFIFKKFSNLYIF